MGNLILRQIINESMNHLILAALNLLLFIVIINSFPLSQCFSKVQSNNATDIIEGNLKHKYNCKMNLKNADTPREPFRLVVLNWKPKMRL